MIWGHPLSGSLKLVKAKRAGVELGKRLALTCEC